MWHVITSSNGFDTRSLFQRSLGDRRLFSRKSDKAFQGDRSYWCFPSLWLNRRNLFSCCDRFLYLAKSKLGWLFTSRNWCRHRRIFRFGFFLFRTCNRTHGCCFTNQYIERSNPTNFCIYFRGASNFNSNIRNVCRTLGRILRIRPRHC